MGTIYEDYYQNDYGSAGNALSFFTIKNVGMYHNDASTHFHAARKFN